MGDEPGIEVCGIKKSCLQLAEKSVLGGMYGPYTGCVSEHSPEDARPRAFD
jgi:hypothetical protein